MLWGCNLANSEKLTDAVALMGLEEAIDSHLFEVTFAEIGSRVTRVKLWVGPYVSYTLNRNCVR